MGSPQAEMRERLAWKFIWVKIPGSQVGRRDRETRREEKPAEACNFIAVAVGARGLILPGSLRIAHVKHATQGNYLSTSS